MGRTGLKEYAETPGNRGACISRRDLDDGRTEVLLVSFWDSMDAVRAFAGDRPERAVFYPEDDRFLIGREKTTTHFDVPLGTPLGPG